jgi:hypothetical protein
MSCGSCCCQSLSGCADDGCKLCDLLYGASVMPHNLCCAICHSVALWHCVHQVPARHTFFVPCLYFRYLHSAVIQTRAYARSPDGRASAIRYGTLDSSFSLVFAFLINASILVLSGAAFYYGSAQHRWAVERCC